MVGGTRCHLQVGLGHTLCAAAARSDRRCTTGRWRQPVVVLCTCLCLFWGHAWHILTIGRFLVSCARCAPRKQQGYAGTALTRSPKVLRHANPAGIKQQRVRCPHTTMQPQSKGATAWVDHTTMAPVCWEEMPPTVDTFTPQASIPPQHTHHIKQAYMGAWQVHGAPVCMACCELMVGYMPEA